jgi:Flp pilus assembly pilin Flp
MFRFKEFIKEEKAAGVVELILILVVLIGLVLIFKDQITDLLYAVFDGIFEQAGELW